MILTKNLECSACGGRQFARIAENEYRCEHCGALTLVEDDVAQRLEQILLKMQARPVPPRRLDPKQARLLAGCIVAVLTVVAALATVSVLTDRGAQRPAAALQAARRIDPSKVKLSDIRETTLGDSRHLVGRMTNDSGEPIQGPSVRLVFWNDASRGKEMSVRVAAERLAPGEYAWFDAPLPREPFSRYDLTTNEVSRPYRNTNGDTVRGAVSAERLQLVQDGDRDLTLVGALKNNGETAQSIAVQASFYDAGHRLVGHGRGYPEANKLAPGESTLFGLRVERVADGAIASYDYLVESEARAGGAGKPATIVAVAEPALRRMPAGLRLGLAELMDPAFALFDTSRLELSSPLPAVSPENTRIFLAEVTNRSADRVAIEPGFTVTFFDGRREAAREQKQVADYLLPGERMPVAFSSARDFTRYSEYKVAWGEFRQSALPGPAPKVEATVETHRAEFGSVLVNFSNRYRYKYVAFGGRLVNRDAAAISSARVTVALYDAQGRITGFGRADVRQKLAPGESVPWSADVTQNGADFASWRVLAHAAR